MMRVCSQQAMGHTLLPYLEQELTGVFCAVEQSDCSNLIPTSLVRPFSVEVCCMPQDGKQRVNSNSSRNQHKVSRGICRLRVKEELSTHSHGHFRVQCTLRGKRNEPLMLCSKGLKPCSSFGKQRASTSYILVSF